MYEKENIFCRKVVLSQLAGGAEPSKGGDRSVSVPCSSAQTAVISVPKAQPSPEEGARLPGVVGGVTSSSPVGSGVL